MKKKWIRKPSSNIKKNKLRRYNVIITTLIIVLFGSYFAWLGVGVYRQEKHDYIVRENMKSLPIPGDSIDPQMVCMVNNMYMGIDQIPVLVQNRTYYGCCDKCVQDLNQDEMVRYAVDPYSKLRIDKALAFITMSPEKLGVILYFESAENARKYLEK